MMNGAPYPPGPAWYVHAVGKCEPVDCDWHEVGAQRLATAHILAVYEQGSARRYVYLRMSQSRPDDPAPIPAEPAAPPNLPP